MYAIDKKRFQEKLDDLKQTVRLLRNIAGSKELSSDEAIALLRVVADYTYALDILDQYDHQVMQIRDTTSEQLFRVTYGAAPQKKK